MLTERQKERTYIPDTIARTSKGMEWVAALPIEERDQLRRAWRVSLAIDALLDVTGFPPGRSHTDVYHDGRKGAVITSSWDQFPIVVAQLRAEFGEAPLLHWFRDAEPDAKARMMRYFADFDPAKHGVAIDYSYFYPDERLAQLERLAARFRCPELSNILRCLFERFSDTEKVVGYAPFEDRVPGVSLRSEDRSAVRAMFEVLKSSFGGHVVCFAEDPAEEEPQYDPEEKTEEQKRLLSIFAFPPGAWLTIDGGYFSLQKYFEKLESLV